MLTELMMYMLFWDCGPRRDDCTTAAHLCDKCQNLTNWLVYKYEKQFFGALYVYVL